MGCRGEGVETSHLEQLRGRGWCVENHTVLQGKWQWWSRTLLSRIWNEGGELEAADVVAAVSSRPRLAFRGRERDGRQRFCFEEVDEAITEEGLGDLK